MYEIIFYTNEKGRSEIQEYLLNLQSKNDKNSRINLEKISLCIDLLTERGTDVGALYIKYLEDYTRRDKENGE